MGGFGFLSCVGATRSQVSAGSLQPLPPPTLAKFLEGLAELLGHEVVDDRVDGAVGVDADPAEEDEPAVQIGGLHEGVHQNQSPVGHPEQGKEDHHHSQHLSDLQRRDKRKE